jgi:hypothetical protein
MPRFRPFRARWVTGLSWLTGITLVAASLVLLQRPPQRQTGVAVADPAVGATSVPPGGDVTTGAASPAPDPATTTTVTLPATTSPPPSEAVAAPAVPDLSCPDDAGTCIQVNADDLGAPLGHSATGFLHDSDVGQPSVASRLAPTSWRVAILPRSDGSLDTTAFDAARRFAPSSITVVVSDAWYWATNNGCGVPSPTCGARPPWRDLGAYSSWVEGYVRQVEATGRHPGYWEVQNEPDNATVPGNYYDVSDAGTVTVPNELEQFETGYDAIKSADPRARVIGPSLAIYRSAPDGRRLDMGTFLAFSASRRLRWDALSWHEITPGPRGPQPDAMITTDVATTRALLATFPSLGAPLIAITEYGDLANRLLPGWIVGDMSALESSGVAWADRTCAVTFTDPAAGDECSRSPSTLDGLLLADGDPTAAYWTYRTYAAFGGRRVAVFSSSPTVSVLATRDPTGTVHVLVGRHETCTRSVNADCTDSAALPPPIWVPMVMAVPWSGAAAVTVQRIPNVRGRVGSPSTVSTGTVSLDNGVLRLTVPAVGDGDALVVTARPA